MKNLSLCVMRMETRREGSVSRASRGNRERARLIVRIVLVVREWKVGMFIMLQKDVAKQKTGEEVILRNWSEGDERVWRREKGRVLHRTPGWRGEDTKGLIYFSLFFSLYHGFEGVFYRHGKNCFDEKVRLTVRY
jgi:hypothetical protein